MQKYQDLDGSVWIWCMACNLIMFANTASVQKEAASALNGATYITSANNIVPSTQ